jgi:hypothetical protein
MGYASEPCRPTKCTRCGALIECGFQCVDLNGGSGHPKRKIVCGQGDCATGLGRRLMYYCSQACEWRHRRARNRVKQLTCAVCVQPFLTTRRDTRYCSNACRQEAYRERG